MPFLRKYNVLLVTGTTAIRIPMIKRNVVDFAVGADWTPAAGDVKVMTDAVAAANITNLPTAITAGNGAYWEFILTAAELSGKQVLVTIIDTAGAKAVEDQSFIVETYGNASAMYVADWSLANLPANVVQLLGTAWLTPGTAGTPDVNAKLLGATAQTGRDIGASVLLSAGTGAGQLDFTSGVVKASLVQILGTALTETAGQIAAAFKQFFDIASPTGTMKAITNVITTTNLTTNNDKTGYGLSAAAIQAIWDALTSALSTAGSIGKLLVDNLNATISSRLATSGYTAPLDAAGTRSAVGLASANIDTQLATIAAYVDTEVAAIKAKTDQLTFTVANVIDANVLRLNGVAASAANLERSASVIYRGAVTGAATTTTLIDSGLTQADTDHWKGRILLFTSGALTYQATDIVGFTPATDTLTFTALTQAPSGADTYVIV